MLNQQLVGNVLKLQKGTEAYVKYVAVCYLPVLRFSSWAVLLFGACNVWMGFENGAYLLKMAFLMGEMMTEAQPEHTNLEFFVFKTHVELQFIVSLFHVMDKALEFGYPEAGCLHS